MRDFNSEITGKEKFLNFLSSFLIKNKTILFILLAIFVLAIVAIGVVNSIYEKRNNQAAIMIEEVQKMYDEWIELTDDETKTEKKDELITKLDDVLDNDNIAFARKRALFIKAEVLYRTENWADAASLYKESANILEESYLSPISLMLAAASYENNSEYQKSLECYNLVCDKYSETYPETARAMLSIGRLYEQLGNNDEALNAYNKLLDKFPSSQWANFAKTKIINY